MSDPAATTAAEETDADLSAGLGAAKGAVAADCARAYVSAIASLFECKAALKEAG